MSILLEAIREELMAARAQTYEVWATLDRMLSRVNEELRTERAPYPQKKNFVWVPQAITYQNPGGEHYPDTPVFALHLVKQEGEQVQEFHPLGLGYCHFPRPFIPVHMKSGIHLVSVSFLEERQIRAFLESLVMQAPVILYWTQPEREQLLDGFPHGGLDRIMKIAVEWKGEQP